MSPIFFEAFNLFILVFSYIDDSVSYASGADTTAKIVAFFTECRLNYLQWFLKFVSVPS